MRFFFPDSQDQIDPDYDFSAETVSELRVRQRHDLYAHEILAKPCYDGILLSKPIVDGFAASSGKYTLAQRHRLYRLGVSSFFRLQQTRPRLATMGDCGSFSYVRDERPPYSVDDVIDFYDGCGFDFGISVDHVVLGWDPSDSAKEVRDWRARQRLTLQLAREFIKRAASRRCRFEPIGAAQGWSPRSYARAADELQALGYRYIALGGMVPLKTDQILDSLRAVAEVLKPGVMLHLLGVSRLAHLPEFARFGVVSFDTTTPFRQAFKDDTENYYWTDRNYSAIRVPQVDGNTRLKLAIRAGRIDQAIALRLEQQCLAALRGFDAGRVGAEDVLAVLHEYSNLFGDSKDRTSEYRVFLEAMPWKRCRCGICQQAGIEIAVFRGAERNKRRGFHNLHIFDNRLDAAQSRQSLRRVAQ